MGLFKRWRRAREASEPEPEPKPEPAVSEPAPARRVKRARRPSTMGKTMAEQAYLAEAAMRAKNGEQGC